MKNYQTKIGTFYPKQYPEDNNIQLCIPKEFLLPAGFRDVNNRNNGVY